jgi:hypothetical protein
MMRLTKSAYSILVQIAILALVVAASVFYQKYAKNTSLSTYINAPPSPPSSQGQEIPEIVKKDCERLVDGQLLFEPSKTMRQGKSYPVFARLSRNPGVNITEGLDGSKFVIVKEKVSCKVSMSLDSQEPQAFFIEKLPTGRKDEQILEPDTFSQWDWRVTPKKHGTLHLLLYVTPLLYVEGIGEALKEFKQPPRIITVTPDYLYESGAFLKENWVIISGLLTVVFIPLFLWFRAGIIDWFKKRFKRKEVFYELPRKKSDSSS